MQPYLKKLYNIELAVPAFLAPSCVWLSKPSCSVTSSLAYPPGAPSCIFVIPIFLYLLSLFSFNYEVSGSGYRVRKVLQVTVVVFAHNFECAKEVTARNDRSMPRSPSQNVSNCRRCCSWSSIGKRISGACAANISDSKYSLENPSLCCRRS